MNGRSVPHGFTLFEALVVLAILGLTASAVAPALTSRSVEEEPARSAGAIVKLLRDSRRVALDHGDPVAVTIFPENGWYEVELRRRGETEVLARGGLPLKPLVRLESDSARAGYTFSATGVAVGRALRVRQGSRIAVVTVEPWTGDPHVATP
jgi:prepilin-type N-terminal cleavage/methylation domain-containing protein